MSASFPIASLVRVTVIAAATISSVYAVDCSRVRNDLKLTDPSPEIIRAVEAQWSKAYIDRDTKTLLCVLAVDFTAQLMSGPTSAAHTRAEVLQWVITHGSTANNKLESLKIEGRGTIALVRGIYSAQVPNSQQTRRFQFIDVFVFRRYWQALLRVV